MTAAANIRRCDCAEFGGFDFLVWLIEAEMLRVRLRAPAPLAIMFANAGRAPLHLDRIWRPLLRMLGAVECEPSDDWHRPAVPYLSHEHTVKAITEAALAGEAVPRLRVNGRTDDPCGAVVITLRECSYDTHRNSNVHSWWTFAQALRERGENVIIVRDTAKADMPLGDLTTYPSASLDLAVRMALYERAKMNFFVSNGPVGLATFSEASPYIYFVTQYAGCHGPQYPWAGKNQAMRYEADSYENLIHAWEISSIR